MSRSIAAPSNHVPSLWSGARSVLGALSRAFTADRPDPRRDELSLEHDRIRLLSRHWLM